MERKDQLPRIVWTSAFGIAFLFWSCTNRFDLAADADTGDVTGTDSDTSNVTDTDSDTGDVSGTDSDKDTNTDSDKDTESDMDTVTEESSDSDSVTETNSDSTSLTFPVRGVFYYAWYPDTWTVAGEHVWYNPDLGYYSSDSSEVADKHIEFMDYAKVDVAIVSWWGQGYKHERERVLLLLNRTKAVSSDLKWTFYYEEEGRSDPSVAQIQSDLAYLKDAYASHDAMATIEDKPVIFVYNNGVNLDDYCEVTDRWSRANNNGEWYVVLRVFSHYAHCQDQPDAWHQYGPISAAQDHRTSYVISPGLWRANESEPTLGRDHDRWYKNVRDRVASTKPWQLITTFNQWGDGSAVEPAGEWSSASGYGQYLDALHNDGVQ